MSGQLGTGCEIRDGRRNVHYRRRRRGRRLAAEKIAALFLVVFSVVSVCAGGIWLLAALPHMELTETVAEPAEAKQPEALLSEPVSGNSGDITVLKEEKREVPCIAIDAGHGGEDEGCSRENVTESEINLALAQGLAGNLNAMGYETVLIREDNMTEMSLEERVQKAEEKKADIFVSIHQNACEEEENQITGIETWYDGGQENGRRLAQLVHRGAVDRTGAYDREVRETDELYVIRNTSMPSCLIETGFLSNREERNLLAAKEYQEKLTAGMAEGIDNYFRPKTMYLTFDDGPSEENTSAVLDILKERGIKATFFVVGENVRKHPDVARRIVEEGHTVGIHCNNHDYRAIYASVDSYLEDFRKAQEAVEEIMGVDVTLFRFPGGSINAYNKGVYEDIIAAMTEKGYIYFDWNASLEDAVKQSTPEGLVQNGLNSAMGRKKVVMLAHDVIYNTVQCLDELLDNLPEYSMEPLTKEVLPIQF